jgi:hypothetical protein
MNPRASSQMVSTSAIMKAFITPSHVVVATQAGTVLLLDVDCTHRDLENNPHRVAHGKAFSRFGIKEATSFYPSMKLEWEYGTLLAQKVN